MLSSRTNPKSDLSFSQNQGKSKNPGASEELKSGYPDSTGTSKLAIWNNKGISKLAIRNNTWNSKLAILNKQQYLLKNFHFEIFEISPTLKILWNIVSTAVPYAG